jgi:hypothetical protein
MWTNIQRSTVRNGNPIRSPGYTISTWIAFEERYYNGQTTGTSSFPEDHLRSAIHNGKFWRNVFGLGHSCVAWAKHAAICGIIWNRSGMSSSMDGI